MFCLSPEGLKTHHSPVTKGRLGEVCVLDEGNCLVVYLPLLVQRSCTAFLSNVD